MLKNSGPNDELINIFNLIQRFAVHRDHGGAPAAAAPEEKQCGRRQQQRGNDQQIPFFEESFTVHIRSNENAPCFPAGSRL